MTVHEVEQIAERVARRVAEGVVRAILAETPNDQIDAAIKQILADFPGIVRIRYNLGEDHSGTPAAFFRVLISDALAEIVGTEDFAEISRHLSGRLENIPLLCAAGRFPYVNWRSVSEQARLKCKEWQ